MQEANFEQAVKVATALREEVSKYVYGQEDLITHVLSCLWSRGHVLITGAPGLAKTMLVRVLAKQLELPFRRIQFTPDLLPSDIVGSEILSIDPVTGKRYFEFSKGPVFTNLLLADEINRASPRTQSALLEAMQERTVTAGGQNHKLEEPFMVLATQNPYESEGTFVLPEAQLDRFLMHILVDYPSVDAEKKVISSHAKSELIGENWNKITANTKHQLSKKDLDNVMLATTNIKVDDSLIDLINRLVRSTRPDHKSTNDSINKYIYFGAGPRAGIALLSAARALALMEGKNTLNWCHIRQMAPATLRHRIKLNSFAVQDEINVESIISELLDSIEKQVQIQAKGV